MLGSVAGSPVVLALKGEELVDGGDGRGVRGLEPELSAPRYALGEVSDMGTAGRHHRRSWDTPVMHEPGEGEIPSGKGDGDVLVGF